MPEEQDEFTETHNVDIKVGVWVDAAFERFGNGERFTFQMTTGMQAPQAPNQPPTPMPAVVFWLPGPMLGTVLTGQFLFSNPCAIEQDEVDNLVRQATEQMLQARSQMLRDTSNGHKPGEPPPSIVLPGH